MQTFLRYKITTANVAVVLGAANGFLVVGANSFLPAEERSTLDWQTLQEVVSACLYTGRE